jgi:hypothetical protein
MNTLTPCLLSVSVVSVFVISGFFAAEAEERKTNITRRKYGYPEKKYMDGKFKIFSCEFIRPHYHM